MRIVLAALTLGLVVVAAAAGCARHHHGPYGRHHHDRYEYRYHPHRLSCGHYVECRWDPHRDRHHYERNGHRRHDRYWHLHRRNGGYEKCYVTRRGHGYRSEAPRG